MSGVIRKFIHIKKLLNMILKDNAVHLIRLFNCVCKGLPDTLESEKLTEIPLNRETKIFRI